MLTSVKEYICHSTQIFCFPMLSFLAAQTGGRHMIINQDCKGDGEEDPHPNAAHSKSLYPNVVDHLYGGKKHACAEVVRDSFRASFSSAKAAVLTIQPCSWI